MHLAVDQQARRYCCRSTLPMMLTKTHDSHDSHESCSGCHGCPKMLPCQHSNLSGQQQAPQQANVVETINQIQPLSGLMVWSAAPWHPRSRQMQLHSRYNTIAPLSLTGLWVLKRKPHATRFDTKAHLVLNALGALDVLWLHIRELGLQHPMF